MTQTEQYAMHSAAIHRVYHIAQWLQTEPGNEYVQTWLISEYYTLASVLLRDHYTPASLQLGVYEGSVQ
jgi:hypothetical protein